ncbi:SpoIIE family protein phosphatase [Streptomyces sp. NPDC048361]|uniref:PP2C family protein-serine/threonine phosphatase n=1 Tax=Streptomyces sp. NPDC048361 TaxID=3154720 RepID=UPI0034389110
MAGGSDRNASSGEAKGRGGRGSRGDEQRHGEPDEQAPISEFLEDSVEDLYDNAPFGYLSTLLDGTIAKVNATLLDWLGRSRPDLVGTRFADLLTVGGKLYHETHFAPLLLMRGEVNGIALELKTADGGRLPVLVTSTVRTGEDGRPLLIRTTLFDARERRAYETELLRASQVARAAQAAAEAAQAAAEAATARAEQASAAVEVERARLAVLTRTLQQTLLPPVLTPVPGLDVAASYHVASVDEVGGDFYDLFPLGEGRWGLFLGDVCGKGAQAAAVTSLARYTLRAAAAYDPDPAAVLRNLNTVLAYEHQGFMPRFCTVVFGVLTPATATGSDGHETGAFSLTLAAGGHPPALLLRADGTVDVLHTRHGQLIGVLPDPYIATTDVTLQPGDTLLLYTDGLTEAHTAVPNRDRYGDEALVDFAAALAPTTATATVAAVADLLDTFGDGVDDDTAVLALSVPARPAEGRPA